MEPLKHDYIVRAESSHSILIAGVENEDEALEKAEQIPFSEWSNDGLVLEAEQADGAKEDGWE